MATNVERAVHEVREAIKTNEFDAGDIDFLIQGAAQNAGVDTKTFEKLVFPPMTKKVINHVTATKRLNNNITRNNGDVGFALHAMMMKDES